MPYRQRLPLHSSHYLERSSREPYAYAQLNGSSPKYHRKMYVDEVGNVLREWPYSFSYHNWSAVNARRYMTPEPHASPFSSRRVLAPFASEYVPRNHYGQLGLLTATLASGALLAYTHYRYIVTIFVIVIDNNNNI